MHTDTPSDVTGRRLTKDRREYAGTQSRDMKTFRVVGVCNEDADDYHLYITNLSREEFLLEDIATLYQSRWPVEVLLSRRSQ